MRPPVIIDTGPLVACINARDTLHAWAVGQLKKVSGPMVTCESVLSEAVFLLRNTAGGTAALTGMLSDGGLRISFALATELQPVRKLLGKYANLPMSLADACLVRMSEIMPDHEVLTADGQFHVYRRERNRPIPLIIPA